MSRMAMLIIKQREAAIGLCIGDRCVIGTPFQLSVSSPQRKDKITMGNMIKKKKKSIKEKGKFWNELEVS